MAKAKTNGNAKAKPKTKAKAPGKRAENLSQFAGPKADKDKLTAQSAKAKKKNKRKAVAAASSDTAADHVVCQHIAHLERARRAWQKARDEAKSAKSILRNFYKDAKADGVDIDAMANAFKARERSVAEFVAEHRNFARYLRLMEAPVADPQLGLFDFLDADAPPVMEPKLAGEHAGRNGESIDNCPHTPGTTEFAHWHEGWTNGQAALQEGLTSH